MKLNCKDAIAQHMRWRMVFQFAIQMKEAISADKIEQILHADRCPIGKWLVSSETLPIRTTPEYMEVVKAHLQFHHEMQQVSTLINSGNYAVASRSLLPGSSFMNASQKIANAISALNRFETP